MAKPSRTYKSDAFRAIHNAAQGLYRNGAIGKERLARYDKLCLIPKRRARS